jgi:hypothetical protein
MSRKGKGSKAEKGLLALLLTHLCAALTISFLAIQADFLAMVFGVLSATGYVTLSFALRARSP